MRSVLESSRLFRESDHGNVEAALDGCRLEAYASGQTVVEQGQPSTAGYVVLAGAPRLLRLEGGKLRHVASLTRGNYFGRTSSFVLPATETVLAESPCEVVVFPADLFAKLHESPTFRAHVQSVYRRYSARAQLELAPPLRGLPAAMLDELGLVLRFEELASDETIASVGDRIDSIRFVRSGAVREVSGDSCGPRRVAGYFMANSSFGWSGLTGHKAEWPTTLETIAPTSLLSLSIDEIRNRMSATSPEWIELIQRARESEQHELDRDRQKGVFVAPCVPRSHSPAFHLARAGMMAGPGCVAAYAATSWIGRSAWITVAVAVATACVATLAAVTTLRRRQADATVARGIARLFED